MSDKKQIFEVLVETQSKSVENLMETSKKLKELFGKSDSLEQSVEMYKEWYSKQEAITKEMMDAVKSQMITDQTPEFIKKWLDSQEQFSEKWMGAMKGMNKGYSSDKVLDNYQTGVDKMFGSWKKSYDQFAGMFSTTFGLKNYDLTTQAKEMHDNFVESTRKYLQLLESDKKMAKASQK